MKLLRRKPFLGIREKMILCCILSTIITIVFSDLVVYWIYQKDITEKEFFYMEDGNQILSDNIDNLISTIEEKLVTELEYCTVFSYQDDLSNLYVADVMRSLKRLVTLMKMRGTNVKSIYILDQYPAATIMIPKKNYCWMILRKNPSIRKSGIIIRPCFHVRAALCGEAFLITPMKST